MWTLKENTGDEHDKYMVVSFINATLVLSIGEKVAEVSDSGLDATKQTIHAAVLEDGSHIQITTSSVIHIKPDKKRIMWKTSGRIATASSNPRQVVLVLQGGELIYFELSPTYALQEVDKLALDSEVAIN